MKWETEIDTFGCVNNGVVMPTNLKLDDRMVAEAVKLGRHKTKREAVGAALAEYVRRRRQSRVEELYGVIEYPVDWDPKAMRRSR